MLGNGGGNVNILAKQKEIHVFVYIQERCKGLIKSPQNVIRMTGE
jgi:hypothetical protein